METLKRYRFTYVEALTGDVKNKTIASDNQSNARWLFDNLVACRKLLKCEAL